MCYLFMGKHIPVESVLFGLNKMKRKSTMRRKPLRLTHYGTKKVGIKRELNMPFLNFKCALI